MSTPNPIPPPAAVVAATAQVTSDMINNLVNERASRLSAIATLQNAAALIADHQAHITALETQLTALGWVVPSS